jgi:DNA primase
MSFVDEFLDWSYQGLLQSEEAQAYLRGRGIGEDQWLRHRLGFTLGEFDIDPARDPGHKPDICHDKEKSFFWCDSCRYRRWASKWEAPEDGAPKQQYVGRRIANCVVFPLTNYTGSVVGFQVRSISEKSYDSFSIRRMPEGYFFGIAAGLHSIWSSQEVWLTEGPGDHLVIERLVAPNVLGITTSSPSILQVRFLRRFVRRINLCLDMDTAGRKSAREFCARYGTEFEIRDVKYPCPGPKDKDPGDYWKRVGDSAFSRYFRNLR